MWRQQTRAIVSAAILLAVGSLWAQQLAPFFWAESSCYDSQVPKPEAILGYQIGGQFTPHHLVVRYMETLAGTSDRVRLVRYGTSYEGRPLLVAVISSPEHLAEWDSLQVRQQRLADPRRLPSSAALSRMLNSWPGVIWLSFNVHGNEASGTEAALQVAYQLAAGTDERTTGILQDLVVILDPVLNPDGRERYVSFYHRTAGCQPNPDPEAAEHHEPWPGGRSNHYYFDLNRDWAWLTQRETRQRVALFRQWMPQVHMDFHEMGYNSSYFFFPARSPINTNIPRSLLKWAQVFGEHNARAFDQHGWGYFTAEGFDLFYPGFGDSWPSLNGALGMTFEQGGGGGAGLAVTRDDGTVLTLTERAWHHFVAAMTSLETARAHRKEILLDYVEAWRQSLEQGRARDVRYYLFPPDADANRQADFVDLLLRQGIEVWRTTEPVEVARAESYEGGTQKLQLPAQSFVVPVAQPAQRLLTALFEVDPVLADTFFYDITAWCLPVVYNLKTFWTKSPLACGMERLRERPEVVGQIQGGQARYAYLLPWEDERAARALYELLRHKWRVRVSAKPFVLGGRRFERGTLVIPVANRLVTHPDSTLHEVVAALARDHGLTFYAANTGLSEEGVDLGSDDLVALALPRVAMVTGSPVSASSYGALWFLLDQHLGIRFTPLPCERLGSADLQKYDVLIFPDDFGGGRGYRSRLDSAAVERLRRWVRDGGTFIGIGGGATFATQEYARLCSVRVKKDKKPREKEGEQQEDPEEVRRMRLTLEQKEKERPLSMVPGAILRTLIDTSHPLGYGTKRQMFTLKTGTDAYELSGQGNNVGIYADNLRFAGFISEKNQKKIAGTGYLIEESLGKGRVILFADDPTFRLLWRGLTRLVVNALFFAKVA
ncbi:MAG: M14 family metallopeptidase [candidate division KSB1 bacterium]|nr:M14 family metallopeptidase [candidate division KSB1 bacterium]MDZ7392346.1 M14 family metallopeptidase [candidate division KSB1 bacterium]